MLKCWRSRSLSGTLDLDILIIWNNSQPKELHKIQWHFWELLGKSILSICNTDEHSLNRFCKYGNLLLKFWEKTGRMFSSLTVNHTLSAPSTSCSSKCNGRKDSKTRPLTVNNSNTFLSHVIYSCV